MDLHSLTRPADSASAFCLQHGLEVYCADAAQLFAVDAHAAAPPSISSNSSQHSSCRFMANYLTAVTCGRQVLWRHYAFVSGTHWNRKCFLAAVQRALPAGPAKRMSFGDILSFLQLLCPDFPTSVVKNAWSSAVSIQEWVDFQKTKQQQQEQEDLQPAAQHLAGAADLVQLPVFWQCLTVTFIYEHCLLFIRREAFDQNKRCSSLQGLEASMQRAVSLMPQNGWPVLPERCWKMAVGQASRAATYPDFAFGDLVRALCCCRELVKAVRWELQETAAAADAASTALLFLPGSRPCSSTDKESESSLP